MYFESGQARRMSRSHNPFETMSTESAAVLSAWESSSHQPQFHQFPGSAYVYRPAAGFTQFPISPVSPTSSTSSSLLSSSPSSMVFSPPSPSSLSELEMLRREIIFENSLRHGSEVAAAADARGRPPPSCLPTNHHFDFNFSLPHPHPGLSLNPSSSSSLPTPLPSPSSLPAAILSPAFPASATSANMHTVSTSLASPGSSESSSSSASLPKRSSSHSECSPSPTASKRPRACMSSKDFIPPDVTGLSKREARLVKNRAAAFLSRQRKREEFELMEIRVAELEQENQRLRHLAGGRSSSPLSSASSDSSELDQLREQLAAARQRETELAHRLETSQHQKVKTEAYEPVLSEGTSSGASSPLLGPFSPLKSAITSPKGGASLGLMVLLCALPSLLSQPSPHSRTALPTSRSFLDNIQWDAPTFFPATTDGPGAPPSLLDWEFDWNGSTVDAGIGRNVDMDVDFPNTANTNGSGVWKKLEFENENELGLGGLGLGALDISFDTRRTKDGKIRVRVHSSPSAPTGNTDLLSPSPEPPTDESLTLPIAVPSPISDQFPFSPLSFPPQSQPSSTSGPSSFNQRPNPHSLSFVDVDPLGPFLGVCAPSASFGLPDSPFDYTASASSTNMSDPQGVREGTRRRVRIALKSLPQPGGEGGEWEVEVR
ncbi:hypothetical protein M0805_000386 [Coniferiporia weirii]|nr:hypothetical protein M0805_000386 [Coniferiporia weirii]